MANMLPLVLDAEATRHILDRLDAPAAMRTLFTMLGEGRAVQPPQLSVLFPDGRGDFIVYTGALPDAGVFGVKLSPYLVAPAVDAGSTTAHVTAWTLLMSATTGQPLLLCDALRLTTARTAATTALAVDLLAPPKADVLTVIGSGEQAVAHLRYVLPLRAWQSVRVYSPRLTEKAPVLRAALQALHPAITLTSIRGDALAEADVVLLCTSSGTPVLDPRELTKPAIITSISTNVPHAHEVAPAKLPDMEVYCDYRATTPATAGEMVLAQQVGWSPADIRGDLGELVTKRALVPSGTRHVFFRSVGLGVEDIQLAHAVYEQRRQEVNG